MKKLIILFSLICVGVLFFASCEHYENVTFAKENSKQYLIYEDSEYSKAAIFTASEYGTRPNEGDIKLGKYYSFPFTTYFYSDELNKPDYIYTVGGDANVYIRNNFDYKSETFVVDNTTETIVFSEAFEKNSVKYDYWAKTNDSIKTVLCSEKHPNLKMHLLLFFENDIWYAGLLSDEAYPISESFGKLLKENDIIE